MCFTLLAICQGHSDNQMKGLARKNKLRNCNKLVPSPLASREGRISQKNSLKPSHGIYKATLKSTTLSEQWFYKS